LVAGKHVQISKYLGRLKSKSKLDCHFQTTQTRRLKFGVMIYHCTWYLTRMFGESGMQTGRDIRA
jgi:hypothetical protein